MCSSSCCLSLVRRLLIALRGLRRVGVVVARSISVPLLLVPGFPAY